ncbi:MAG: hypothetical protein ACXVH3_36360 [Solirubrobacteraceae bacterium]
MDERAHARDEPTLPVDGRARYGRDWLIAAGSVVPVVGVAFPFYLAWRDDRRRLLAACFLLFLAAAACFPLSDAGATIDGIAILVVWLAGMAVAIVLASTVPPEHRRASAKHLRAHRPAAHRSRDLAQGLAAAGAVDSREPRLRGGTALTEPVVLVEGVHRATYQVLDRDDRSLGQIQPAGRCPPAHRARYELLAADGSPVLAMHVAQRTGGHPDVILAADDTELVRLQPAGPDRRPFGRVGFGARWLISGEERIGHLGGTEPRRRPQATKTRQRQVRVITDASGAEVARVVRVLGGAGPSGTDRRFVVELSDGDDDRIRAAALFVGVLWDWYIVSWDAGGG